MMPRSRRTRATDSGSAIRAAAAAAIEPLERRRMLAMTHLYAFNDGTINDAVGTAHGTLHNGAQVSNGRLLLENAGVTSGQSTVVKYGKLPANILPAAGSATVELWYTTFSATPNWQRVFDFGDQSGSNGNTYLGYTPKSAAGVARAMMKPAGLTERAAVSATRANHGYAHHAAVVLDSVGGQLHLYVDGALAGSTALNGATLAGINDVNGYLGRSLFNADAGFSGAIDELRIYDDAVPAATLAANAAAGATPFTTANKPARQMENLDRGIVAMSKGGGQVYVGWRLLGNDPSGVAFNLYRSVNGGAPLKLNALPLTSTTDFTDAGVDLKQVNTYTVRAVVGGVEQAAGKPFVLGANTSASPYLSVPMQVPAGGLLRDGVPYRYQILDASVADLDGDGAYDFVVQWDTTNDGGSAFTGPILIEGYKADGTRLWQVNLGRNVTDRNDGYLVYDFDGDGKAELVTRTADGTVSGTGQVIGNASADWVNDTEYPVGWTVNGPEYFTIFNGQTGAAMATQLLEPARGNLTDWGDDYGQRAHQLFIVPAYLDGARPSIVFSRGIYLARSPYAAQTQQVAYDWRNGQITKRWHFRAGRGINNDVNSNFVGQGNHQVTVADVDGDGKDEIINGAMVVDDDGKPLASSELEHGDAVHVSDLDPTRPGLEVFGIHENEGTYDPNRPYGAAMYDPRTGQTLWGAGRGIDVGRGNAADIDPTRPGAENWGGPPIDNPTGPGVVRDAKGQTVTNSAGTALPVPNTNNFLLWWDGDLTRELLDRNYINKWDWTDGSSDRLLTASGVATSQSTKQFPALTGDLLGDWREEVVWKSADSRELRIYTTTLAATNRIPTLMHDSQYRMATLWQNNAYNQPPHPSFFIGAGMDAVPQPNIFVATNATAAPAAPANLTATAAGGPKVNLAWSAVGGATKYRVKRSDNPGGPFRILADNVTGTSFVDATVKSGGSYQYVVTAVAGGANESAASVAASATIPLVSPWVAQDIGATALAGRTTWEDGRFTVTASGADIYNATDSFRFVHRPVSGDGSIVAKVESVTNTADGAKYGVMFRKSTSANAAFADLYVTPDGHVFFQTRGTDGANVTWQVAYSTAPLWLKLTRTGSSFTAYYGADGVNWTQVGGARTVAGTTLGGLIACSLDNYEAGTAIFSNVSLPGAGSIAGQVFHDIDGDGALDAGEATFAGVTVFLDANNDGALDAGEASTTTSDTGAYAFGALAAGSHTVRAIAPTEFVSTGAQAVTLPANGAITVNLANARTVYHGTDGADRYLVRRIAGGKYEILIDDALAYTVFPGVPSLAFNLAGGDDTMTLDLGGGGGVPLPAGGATFDGGAGTGDALAVLGSTGPDGVTFAAAGVTTGGITFAASNHEIATFDGRSGGDGLTVNGGPAVVLPNSQQLQGMSIAAGATVAVPAGADATILTGALTVSGRLDLADNDLAINYAAASPIGSWTGSAYTGTAGSIRSGRNGGAWNGDGIITSAAGGITKSLGVNEASTVLGISGTQTALWNGQVVDATTVLVKFTHAGDADLNGRVDGDDYFIIDARAAAGGSGAWGWWRGDFDYNGKINGDDYFLIDSNVNAVGL
ncbi:MAG TPA: SdrD B-like domain-containing protein [Tepidisphaeraceae bacterium]|nr:SdrD B-like domain-containing protein [Tepidisphaeraceae bacterium]